MIVFDRVYSLFYGKYYDSENVKLKINSSFLFSKLK